MSHSSTDAPVIVLYDGVCALCNWWVKFILRFDRAERFAFAALQSDYAASLLQRRNVHLAGLSSIIVIYPDRVLLRSDAVLSILGELSFPWPLLGFLRVIPRFMRDAAYNFVAGIRYKTFGKFDACPLPGPEVRKRFLDQH